MTTRAELRADLRRRLGDASAQPLWPDADLDGFLADAVHLYGHWRPATATTTAAVADGALRITLGSHSDITAERPPPAVPPPDPTPGRVGPVRDPDGSRGRRLAAPPTDDPGAGQGWWFHAAGIELQLGADGGFWGIDHWTGRALLDDDTSAQPIVAGDEPAVVLIAAAAAVEQRAADDYKRGLTAAADLGFKQAIAWRAEARALVKPRAARGSVLERG